MDGLCLPKAIRGVTPAMVPTRRVVTASVSTVAWHSAAAKTAAVSRFSFRANGAMLGTVQSHASAAFVEERPGVIGGDAAEAKSFIMKLLEVPSLWRGSSEEAVNGEDRVEGSDGGDAREDFDRDSFSRLLRRVSVSEAELYAQLSDLGGFAYCIPKIKPENLLQSYGLRFVTSSIEKRETAAKAAEIDKESPAIQEPNDAGAVEDDQNSGGSYIIGVSEAFHIIASAAYSLHWHTSRILPFGPSKNDVDCSEMPLPKATSDSIAAVVAANEEFKEATLSSPCEWYVCDDDKSATRFFAIQGSESLASWLANVLFDPVEFEGLGVMVHRGIYATAKGIYKQMLPEIRAHLKSRGGRAKFRFTGHSLGGSLALLINLMLLIREEVPVSSLLPVVTFGAPAIMGGGDELLRKLKLPRSHVKSITMHRDIVPRAFSCHYPSHVTDFLKAISSSFRNHPCLSSKHCQLYAPVGDLLILQPDEEFSPSHDLLPPGIGLYVMTSSRNNSEEKRLCDAIDKFLNTPHPLDVLVDRASYGSNGAVQRNHDMSSYMKCVRGFIQQEERRSNEWWAMPTPHGVRVVQKGWSSVGRAAGSATVRVLVVLLLPAKLLVMGALSVIRFQ